MCFQGSVQQQSWLPAILTQQKKHVIYSSEKWMHNKIQHNKSLSARIMMTASRQTMVYLHNTCFIQETLLGLYQSLSGALRWHHSPPFINTQVYPFCWDKLVPLLRFIVNRKLLSISSRYISPQHMTERARLRMLPFPSKKTAIIYWNYWKYFNFLNKYEEITWKKRQIASVDDTGTGYVRTCTGRTIIMKWIISVNFSVFFRVLFRMKLHMYFSYQIS